MHGTLARDRVVPLLRGRFGRPYLYAETCGSTQHLLDSDLPEGAVAACEAQTAGRGRLGRRWEAPPGTSVLFSILLRPPPGRAIAELSLVAGLGVADAVERATNRPTSIKWPNDVLLEGGKVAGILAEAKAGTVVVGVGLNVNQRLDALPVRPHLPATSIRAVVGAAHDRAQILADLLALLEARYDEWSRGGLAALHADVGSRDALRGRHVQVGAVSGIARGIDLQGHLEVETAEGTRVVTSGEASVVPIAG